MPMFDVVLSFAGEDREYVEKIAYMLKGRGIKVFYDKFVTSTLWGNDLYQYLHDIYKNKAKYCITFISSNYIKKKWTMLELRSAQARDFECKNEYILPIYLEEEIVPGLDITIGCIKANEYSPEQIVGFVEEKLECNFDRTELYRELEDHLMNFVITYVLIGGEREVYFWEEQNRELKSFLLGNALNLNQEIYLACCAMISDIERKFTARTERHGTLDENVVNNLMDATDIYSKLKKMIAVIEYYVNNNYDDNIDFFSVCEEYGFFDKCSDEETEVLIEEVMGILERYETECECILGE